ncbi:hypothetical protein C4577_05655 [Candidatus Parcubacteria bacterium]|nr:MAG: hypothetical protein C4577_05655 [Candidatus Parcubacteria bacterium]
MSDQILGGAITVTMESPFRWRVETTDGKAGATSDTLEKAVYWLITEHEKEVVAAVIDAYRRDEERQATQLVVKPGDILIRTTAPLPEGEDLLSRLSGNRLRVLGTCNGWTKVRVMKSSGELSGKDVSVPPYLLRQRYFGHVIM